MIIRRLDPDKRFFAGDLSLLQELLHSKEKELSIRYSLAHVIVKPGEHTLPHRLKSSEVYYILKGRGTMCIEREQASIGPGETVYIPPLAVQHVENSGEDDLEFLCIVDPAWRIEDEEIVKES